MLAMVEGATIVCPFGSWLPAWLGMYTSSRKTSRSKGVQVCRVWPYGMAARKLSTSDFSCSLHERVWGDILARDLAAAASRPDL